MRTNHPDPRERIRFGGWSDYQEWADHDFRPRTPDDQGSGARLRVPTVERLVELAPITLNDITARNVCQLVAPREAEPEPDGFDEFELDFELDTEERVRPYIRAGGRAEATHDLEFESVLSATGQHEFWAEDRELDPDVLRICANCAAPRSVAETAAELDLPIGVAMVLIGDAIDAGLLTLHDRPQVVDGRPTMDLLRRLHGGIANLA